MFPIYQLCSTRNRLWHNSIGGNNSKLFSFLCFTNTLYRTIKYSWKLTHVKLHKVRSNIEVPKHLRSKSCNRLCQLGTAGLKLQTKWNYPVKRENIYPSQRFKKKCRSGFLLLVSYLCLNEASFFPKYKFDIKINEKANNNNKLYDNIFSMNMYT